jgi:hypothetical protein
MSDNEKKAQDILAKAEKLCQDPQQVRKGLISGSSPYVLLGNIGEGVTCTKALTKLLETFSPDHLPELLRVPGHFEDKGRWFGLMIKKIAALMKDYIKNNTPKQLQWLLRDYGPPLFSGGRVPLSAILNRPELETCFSALLRKALPLYLESIVNPDALYELFVWSRYASFRKLGQSISDRYKVVLLEHIKKRPHTVSELREHYERSPDECEITLIERYRTAFEKTFKRAKNDKDLITLGILLHECYEVPWAILKMAELKKLYGKERDTTSSESILHDFLSGDMEKEIREAAKSIFDQMDDMQLLNSLFFKVDSLQSMLIERFRQLCKNLFERVPKGIEGTLWTVAAKELHDRISGSL